MGVGCNLVQFVVYCVLFVMISGFRGGTCLDKHKNNFFLGRKSWSLNEWRGPEGNSIQLSAEGEVNSGVIPRREALRYISNAVHRPFSC